MASSSRPFESQTVSRLMAVYRSLQYNAKTLWAKGRLALTWGVQVAAFPAYVAFQSMRMGYRRLQSHHPWQAVKRLLLGTPVQEFPVTADTPILSLLSAIQPPITPTGGGLGPINCHGFFLRQSHAGGVLTNGGWHLVPLKQPIRGIASDLATRKLVLVTAENSIFDGLTEDQQHLLERAIALLMAEYAATLKQRWWQYQLRQPSLPLPKGESAQWLPIRWVQQAMGWMQIGGLAVATNLFGESEQLKRLQRIQQQRRWAGVKNSLQPVPDPLYEAPEWLQPKAFMARDRVALGAQSSMLLAEESSHSGGSAPAGLIVKAKDPEGVLPYPGFKVDWSPEQRTVDVQVSGADYIDQGFVGLLRWIDQGLYWLEQVARQIWQWLRQYL